MSDLKHVLIYGSHFEHINRGCMEDLLRRFRGSEIKLTLLQCQSSHEGCYLNQCLSNSGLDFNYNVQPSCQVCVNNQSVFNEYASLLDIPFNTIYIPRSANNVFYSDDLINLVKTCLPSVANPNLASIIEGDPVLNSLCLDFCLSADFFVVLFRAVLGEVASIRKDTSYLERFLPLICVKLKSIFSVVQFIQQSIKFQDIDFSYIFNGRFLVGKTLSYFCQINSIPWSTYEGSFEWGPSATKYNLVDNGSLQNFTARSATLYHYSNDPSFLDFKSKSLMGSRILKDRVIRKKQSAGYKLFVRNDFKSAIIETPYLLFLTTSLFEFYLTDDFLDGAVSDQLSMIKQILSCIPDHLTLVIREHPNSINADSQFKSQVYNLVFSHLPSERVRIIKSEHNIDTYLLILGAEVVLGSSSMALAESIFLSVPTYYLSPSIFSKYIPSRYLPWRNKSTLSSSLYNPSLPTIPEIRSVCKYFFDYNQLFGGRPSSSALMRDLVPSIPILRSCRHYDHLIVPNV